MFLFILLFGMFLLTSVCAHHLVTTALAPRRLGYEPPSPRFSRYIGLIVLAAACAVPLLSGGLRWYAVVALILGAVVGGLSHLVIQLDNALSIARSLGLVGIPAVQRTRIAGQVAGWTWILGIIVAGSYAGWAAAAAV